MADFEMPPVDRVEVHKAPDVGWRTYQITVYYVGPPEWLNYSETVRGRRNALRRAEELLSPPVISEPELIATLRPSDHDHAQGA